LTNRLHEKYMHVSDVERIVRIVNHQFLGLYASNAYDMNISEDLYSQVNTVIKDYAAL